jgi:hypothetical protein
MRIEKSNYEKMARQENKGQTIRDGSVTADFN